MADIYDYEPLFGTYKIEGQLGFGGFGEVYKVSKNELDIEIKKAVKIIHVLDEKNLEKIIREIKTVKQIGEHDNIVRIEDFTYKPGKRGGDLLIMMELLTSLDSVIENNDLSVEEVIKLGIHTSRALEACETKAVIHRDVKPSNILKGENGVYKLGDFGIARSVEKNMSTHMGTKEFEAPEVYLYEPYDNRADIYSLGITLYYLLNGNKLPFEPDEMAFTRRIARREKVPELIGEGISKALLDIVLKSCEYEPAIRYQKAREMREDLEKVWTYKKDKDYNFVQIVQEDKESDDEQKFEQPVTIQEEIGKYQNIIKSNELPPWIRRERILEPPRMKSSLDVAVEILQGKKRNVKFGRHNWQVLDIHDNRALLLTEDIIERRCYNTQLTDVTWEGCTLRQYLNEEFFRKFNSQEQARIIEVSNVTNNNQWFGTEGGNITKDKVFLLSIEETVKYFGDSGQLKNKNSESKYWIIDEYNNNRIKNLWWWLRSPGAYSDNTAYVNISGYIHMFGYNVNRGEVGVRPALWLNLIVQEDKKSDNEQIKKSTGVATEIVQGKKRNVQFGGYNWRVLDVQGDRALLLTEDIIEKRCYNTELIGVTWEICTLRKYLNGKFFRKFNGEERARIIEVNNVNKDNQWFGTKGGNNTKDKIFLLSIEETVKYFGDSGQLKNKNLESKYWIDDKYNNDRIAKYENEELWWWFRSLGHYSYLAASVERNGSLDMRGGTVDDGEVGVRPALWLNLKSEILL